MSESIDDFVDRGRSTSIYVLGNRIQLLTYEEKDLRAFIEQKRNESSTTAQNDDKPVVRLVKNKPVDTSRPYVKTEAGDYRQLDTTIGTPPKKPEVKLNVIDLGSKKPKIQIRDWFFTKSPYTGKTFLSGRTSEHPRFTGDAHVNTSTVIKPAVSLLPSLHEGDVVETKNSIYILVGETSGASHFGDTL